MLCLLFSDKTYFDLKSWKQAGITALVSWVWGMVASVITSLSSQFSSRFKRAWCRACQWGMLLCWYSCVVLTKTVVLVLNALQILQVALKIIIPTIAAGLVGVLCMWLAGMIWPGLV